ncbi:hypothetical protein C0991_011227 [Blastosporella zonata]|nr:hypothetical protein C0991_011227 [Blastosporella zonata]
MPTADLPPVPRATSTSTKCKSSTTVALDDDVPNAESPLPRKKSNSDEDVTGKKLISIMKDKIWDIDHFFDAPQLQGTKKCHWCKLCMKESGQTVELVNEVSTLRRHIALIMSHTPISALEHPKFIELINIASCAPNGIKIPNCVATGQHIMDLFCKNIQNLLNCFQSNAVSGEVSMTCDAWQAGNSDAYFAVTGRWIEETSKGVWDEKSAIFGFTQMNSAHDRKCLSQALFCIVCRLGLMTKYVNEFLSEIQREEPNFTKQNKIDALMLSDEEWKQLKKFINILDLPDCAQQAFSAENAPTLHNGLPALEALHAA